MLLWNNKKTPKLAALRVRSISDRCAQIAAFFLRQAKTLVQMKDEKFIFEGCIDKHLDVMELFLNEVDRMAYSLGLRSAFKQSEEADNLNAYLHHTTESDLVSCNQSRASLKEEQGELIIAPFLGPILHSLSQFEGVLDTRYSVASRSVHYSKQHEEIDADLMLLPINDVQLKLRFKTPAKEKASVVNMDCYKELAAIIKRYDDTSHGQPEYSAVLFELSNPSPKFAMDFEIGVTGISVCILSYDDVDSGKQKIELLVLILDKNRRLTLQFVITSLYRVKSLLISTDAFDRFPFIRVNRQLQGHYELIFRVSSKKAIYFRWPKVAATEQDAWTSGLRPNHFGYEIQTATEAVSTDVVDFNFALRTSDDPNPESLVGFLIKRGMWYTFRLALCFQEEKNQKCGVESFKKWEFEFPEQDVGLFSLVFRQPRIVDFQDLSVTFLGLKTVARDPSRPREEHIVKLFAKNVALATKDTKVTEANLPNVSLELNKYITEHSSKQNLAEEISNFVNKVDCAVALHVIEEQTSNSSQNVPVQSLTGPIDVLEDTIFEESISVVVGGEQALYCVRNHSDLLSMLKADLTKDIEDEFGSIMMPGDNGERIKITSIASKNWWMGVRNKIEVENGVLWVMLMLNNGGLCDCQFRYLPSPATPPPATPKRNEEPLMVTQTNKDATDDDKMSKANVSESTRNLTQSDHLDTF